MTQMIKTRAESPTKVVDGDWHKKIARNRGRKWKKNMMKGRLEALLYPTAIRNSRLKKSVYQSDIASKLNITPSTYGAIERGKQMVKKDLALKICKYLERDMSDLFDTIKRGKYLAKQAYKS